MFDKPNFTRALRDLACLLLLFCLRRTSFPPREWEASPPPTGTQLPGFPPLKPVVGPGDEGPSSFEHFLSPGWMAPSQGHFPGNLLCAEEFQSPNQAAGRQHFPSALTGSWSLSLESLVLLKPSPLLWREDCAALPVCSFTCL